MGNPIQPKSTGLTIALDPELRAAIEAARKRLARGGEEPSAGAVVRECLRLSLPTLSA